MSVSVQTSAISVQTRNIRCRHRHTWSAAEHTGVNKAMHVNGYVKTRRTLCVTFGKPAERVVAVLWKKEGLAREC